MEGGIISENCGYFVNLDSTFTRIRINNDVLSIIISHNVM